MPEDCPIVPVETIRLTYGTDEDDFLCVAPTHDTVHMFPDPKYNYLRYYDAPDRQMIAVFLAQEVLTDLIEGGIPFCIRHDITEVEVEVYNNHIAKVATAGCVEVEELTEAEIEYFWKENDS